jgi:hypothetical protein
MPILDKKIPDYRPAKSLIINWDNYKDGLDTLLAPTEIKDTELSQAYNLMLKGKGIPTKRWGTKLYHQAGNATGSVRALFGYYPLGSNELLSITDDGYLTKKSGASYTMVSGFSWASGYPCEMRQIGDKAYIVQQGKSLARYGTPSLAGFATIATPTGVFATQLSGASGVNELSYRVAALGVIGETLASTAVSLSNQPFDLVDGTVRIGWATVADATGYVIYGRLGGLETFLASVDPKSTQYDDDGSADPSMFAFPQYEDTTAGPKAKYIERFQDQLVYAGFDDDPTLLMVTGRYPNQEKLHWSVGGSYVKIDPDSGDAITGIKVHGSKIVVFKERSIWEVTFSEVSIGNFTIQNPTYKLITASVGCTSFRSIVPVENDIFFLSRKGVYVIGHEPNIMADVLRTNELSAKIRPLFEGLTISQMEKASGTYHDFKYILSFPGKGQTVVYDRERLSWMGPWTVEANGFETYYDSDKNEHLLYQSTASALSGEFDQNTSSDFGTAFSTILRTKKSAFGDWAQFKLIEDVFMNVRNVSGTLSASIRTEERDGTVRTAKSFNIESTGGNSGWGADMWGNALWADSEENGSTSGGEDDVVRWAMINKIARNIQIEMTTDAIADNYELLAIRANAKPSGKGLVPTSWRV